MSKFVRSFWLAVSVVASLVLRADALGKFEPARGCYLGALLEEGGTATEITKLNADAGKQHAVYAKFLVLSRDAFPFPSDWVNTVKAISPGSGVHLTLEPMTGFEDFFAPNWGPGQPTYENSKLFAEACRDAGLPIFLRFAHEANGNWYPWAPSYTKERTANVTPADYIRGFQNFAALVHQTATNVAMVWAPNQGNGTWPLTDYALVYPGDEAVDWVGLSVYNGDWYGNGNQVMDYELRNAIQRGYWQYNDNPNDDTAQDFYSEFSVGHGKPMMLAETASQFLPSFSWSAATPISSFETLNAPGFYPTRKIACFNNMASDGWTWAARWTAANFDDVSGWWPAWHKLDWSSVNYAPNVWVGRLHASQPLASGETYVGGSGYTWVHPSPNSWSTRNAVQIEVARDTNSTSTANPILVISLRDGTHTATVSRVIQAPSQWGTPNSMQVLNIPNSEFSAPSDFSWYGFCTVTLELMSDTAGVTPPDVLVDNLALVNVFANPVADQDWWPGGPQCLPWGDAAEPGAYFYRWTNDTVAGEVSMIGMDYSNLYIGGNGFTTRPGAKDWSRATHLAVTMRRGPMVWRGRVVGICEPILSVDLVDNANRRASFSQTASFTNDTLCVFPRSAMIIAAGFNWSNVDSVVFHTLSSSSSGMTIPCELIVTEFSMGTSSVNSVEQDWWPKGNVALPWGNVFWQTTTDKFEGQRALQIAPQGSVTGWYWGGNGCSLDAKDQNWSQGGCNTLVFYAKRGIDNSAVDPVLKITLDSDNIEANGTEAEVTTRIGNSDAYREIVIRYADFKTGVDTKTGKSFSWTNVISMKMELFTSIGGKTPAPLFLDGLKRVASTLMNNADNLKWKTDWMRQVYSTRDFSDSDPNNPDYVDISTVLPNVHMINWFHVKKFEDGESKDFRIPEDGVNPPFKTYNDLVKTNYFLSTIAAAGPVVNRNAMTYVGGSSFLMGDTFGEGQPRELPVRNIKLSWYDIGKFEVTKELWDTVRNWALTNNYPDITPGAAQGLYHPIHGISWYDTVKWCNARSQKEGYTPAYYMDPAKTVIYRAGSTPITAECVSWWSTGYRLPTEAEWEKAARGKLVGHHYPWFSNLERWYLEYPFNGKANYIVSGDPFEWAADKTTPVGYYNGLQTPSGSNMTNGYGMYDTAGNVAEWCWDYFNENTYALWAWQTNDPTGPEFSMSPESERVIRGGSCLDDAGYIRCAARDTLPAGSPDRSKYLETYKDVGFRCVRRPSNVIGPGDPYTPDWWKYELTYSYLYATRAPF